mmetsp:Transcript_4444/g.5990  ORF Transcript_4444/g.5990 Transcript_4444/m.5990 type:complete len:150 (-) Transcript_4444:363-812(-)
MAVELFCPSKHSNLFKALASIEYSICHEYDMNLCVLYQELMKRNTKLLFTRTSEVAGYILVSWNSVCGCVTQVAVCENQRGRGLGGALLAAALQFLKERKVQCVSLHVDPKRIAPMSLYKKFKFVFDAVVSDYYGKGQDAHRLTFEFED